jgi:hypothetical protein
MRRFVFLCAVGLFVAAPVHAEHKRPIAAPRDIGPGDPLRKPLLDALRPTVEKDLGQPVRFVVEKLRRQQGWVFIVAYPQTPAGRSIDFMKTRHAERAEAGLLDGDTLYALLQQRGQKWTVLDYVIGPTDVTYAGWPDDYGAPPALFGLRNEGLASENQPQNDDDRNGHADQPQQ